MKKPGQKKQGQPKPFTPGLSKTDVRMHAFKLYHQKLAVHELTLEDWILAERDLVRTLEQEQAVAR